MKNRREFNTVSLIFLLIFQGFSLIGQGIKNDTVNLDLNQAEKLFIATNFQLLAQKYNIEAQRALIIQAKLWPNPNLSLSRGPIIPIYDSKSNYPRSNFFNNSENAVSISQLIQLAGKRIKQIKIAEANSNLAEFQFYDLMANLKYSLRSNFFNVYYLQLSAKVYDAEIKSLQKVVNAYTSVQGKGYIAEKEIVRIKAQLYSFENEYNTLLNQIRGLESQLRLLLTAKPNIFIVPVIDSLKIKELDPSKFSYSTLMDSAFANRSDLQIARTNIKVNTLTYNYQRALAVPDFNFSFSYDRQGSYATNFNSLGLSFDLPFFNQNQGNIKSAKFNISNTQAQEKNTEAFIIENINNSLNTAFAQNKLFQSIDPKFTGEFERLAHEVLINYERRNIGLLDFIDFYDAYKQNILQLNTIQYNRVQAFEDLNFYTDSHFFN